MNRLRMTMQNPDSSNLVYLMPGDFFWGDKNSKITTVLGSCVSICLWHPHQKIGGICHFRLPGRRNKKRLKPNLSYGDDAVWLMLDKIRLHNTEIKDYIVKVFGGADMFIYSTNSPTKTIGNQNVESALSRLATNGFKIKVKHVHGNSSRKLVFDLEDGSVLLYDTKSGESVRF